MMRFMLPTIGSTMMQAMRSPSASNAASTAARSLYGQHDRLVGDRRRHARRRRLAERQRARARLHEQAVAVTVVAAFELHDLAAARVAAREPQRRHRRLGARRHEAHHLDRRQQPAERLRHLDLDLGRRAERQPVPRRLVHRAHDRRDARGRGSPVPTTRRSRCSACRRRPTGTRLRRASKKRGVPPTERNARTGELTPAGIVRCARAKSSSLRLMESMSGARSWGQARARR